MGPRPPERIRTRGAAVRRWNRSDCLWRSPVRLGRCRTDGPRLAFGPRRRHAVSAHPRVGDRGRPAVRTPPVTTTAVGGSCREGRRAPPTTDVVIRVTRAAGGASAGARCACGPCLRSPSRAVARGGGRRRRGSRPEGDTARRRPPASARSRSNAVPRPRRRTSGAVARRRRARSHRGVGRGRVYGRGGRRLGDGGQAELAREHGAGRAVDDRRFTDDDRHVDDGRRATGRGRHPCRSRGADHRGRVGHPRPVHPGSRPGPGRAHATGRVREVVGAGGVADRGGGARAFGCQARRGGQCPSHDRAGPAGGR